MTVVLKFSFSHNKCSTEDRIMKFCVSLDINLPVNYREIVCKLAVRNVRVLCCYPFFVCTGKRVLPSRAFLLDPYSVCSACVLS